MMTGKIVPENYDRDQQTRVPFEHYLRIYRNLDPRETAPRCGLSFDRGAFSLRILGSEHRVLFPEFSLIDPSGKAVESPYEKILFIRYLCEGKYFPARGRRLAYNEIPWGSVYYRNFEGRCLRRCASAFGKDIPGFRRLIEGNASLRAEALKQGDAGYRFEFINGLFVSLILWGADDEFPPSAQMLFDDNFVFAFTAEDLAAAGEVIAGRLKEMKQKGGCPDKT
ncbi:MAG: DUF3786 domain-containing protein [Treponema sp.]|jgi:hypothetical protein|nr:DUF3786 domain-containing protein [Treponema sp.]